MEKVNNNTKNKINTDVLNIQNGSCQLKIEPVGPAKNISVSSLDINQTVDNLGNVSSTSNLLTSNMYRLLIKWIDPIFDEQQLDYLEQVSYQIIVNENLLQNNSDSAYLIINSNGSNPTQIVPVNVEYTEEPGLTGDINGDQIVNILDVVVLVNIVLSGQEYDENADINADGILNVLDIVVLVNIVLNS